MIKEEARDTQYQACRMSALNTVPYVVTLPLVCGLQRPFLTRQYYGLIQVSSIAIASSNTILLKSAPLAR